MEPECQPEHRPNSAKALFIGMIISGVLIIGLVVASVADKIADDRAMCRRAVEVREDGRAMWLAVFELFPDSDAVIKLRVTLDELLPPLTCPPSAEQDQIPREAPRP